MANQWELYQLQPSFVLGFHGTEKTLVEKVISARTEHLAKSEGKYEWLGHGVYFWENDPQRGFEWAQDGNVKHKIQEPDVVGAIIDLGRCLDLTTRVGLEEVEIAHAMVRDSYSTAAKKLPVNIGGDDKFKRELDCQVIQAIHLFRKDNGLLPYDTVRAPFQEDRPLYEGEIGRAS
ncbi:MAG: hypothetical protein R8K20_00095, partial [Gallionellaceae bacterium]